MIIKKGKKVVNLYKGNISLMRRYKGDKLVWLKLTNNPEDYIADVGDVCLVDNNNPSKKIFIGTKNLGKYKDTHTPIGVVVIPSSHDVYGTGECAILSLKYLNYNTPETGGMYANSMYWGQLGEILDKINTAKPQLSNYSAINPTITSNNSGGYFPSDKFGSNISGQDRSVGYNNSGINSAIPSPYLTDGSRNPLYYDTNIVTDNMFSFFDGKEISEKAWNLLDSRMDWKNTTGSLTNAPNKYTAFAACWKYFTKGTEQGDWYLPSSGEIGYMMARFNTFNSIINEINKIWPNSSIILNSDGTCFYWTTNEFSSTQVWVLETFSGKFDGTSLKELSALMVRAFCRIKTNIN